jgi:hypothetical protein
LPPENTIIAVPIGFQLMLFSSEETRRRISRNEVGADNKYEASLDTNMCQGTMAMMGTLGREMREIQILADAESPPDAAPADGSIHVKKGTKNHIPAPSPNQHSTPLLLVDHR